MSTCGITLRFRRLPPTCRADCPRVPHPSATPRPRRPRVRLACIRHAASVDPEPGSNSPPKCLRCAGFQARPPKALRSDPTSWFCCGPARALRALPVAWFNACCAFKLEPRPIPRPARRRRPPRSGHPRRSSAHSVFHGPGLPSVRILVNVLSVRISGPKFRPRFRGLTNYTDSLPECQGIFDGNRASGTMRQQRCR